MKSLALLGFAFAMSPALVGAQEGSTAGASAPLPRPNFAAMQQMHAQMDAIHKQTRSQVLAALTPAHRRLLAGIVGELAIAPNPDRAAAVRTLDAALSQTEARSILSAEDAARKQAHSLMEASRAQFEASLTPEQRTEMQQRMAARESQHPDAQMHPQRSPDAGRTLLDLALGHGEEHRGFGPGGPPMGAPPPPQ